MTMTPEDAREILGTFLQESISDQQAKAEYAYRWWLTQREIVWGGLDQARNVIDQRKADRSHRLAQLWTRIVSSTHGGPPLENGEEEEHERLMAEIDAEADLELATNGLPEAWRPQ